MNNRSLSLTVYRFIYTYIVRSVDNTGDDIENIYNHISFRFLCHAIILLNVLIF